MALDSMLHVLGSWEQEHQTKGWHVQLGTAGVGLQLSIVHSQLSITFILMLPGCYEIST